MASACPPLRGSISIFSHDHGKLLSGTAHCLPFITVSIYPLPAGDVLAQQFFCSNLQSDGSHQFEGVAFTNYAWMEMVIESHAAIVEMVLKMHV
jgi:hypothetical protein